MNAQPFLPTVTGGVTAAVGNSSGDMGASGGTAVEVRSVTKHFEKPRDETTFVALDDINLTVKPGEFVTLVGPSGCGKSTLLRIIAGLLRTTGGDVKVLGSPVKGPRADVGVMFQRATLFPWRTVLANVLLPIELHRKPTSDDIDRAKHLIELVQLGSFIDHYPRELSGGMQQRAALSRVLMVQPKVMLLDEPFGALDEFTREALNLEVAEIAVEAGASVILVTHSISEAVFLADRVVAMGTAPGRITGIADVPMERPRPISAMRAPEFQEISFKVRELLGLDRE